MWIDMGVCIYVCVCVYMCIYSFKEYLKFQRVLDFSALFPVTSILSSSPFSIQAEIHQNSIK